MVVGNVVADAPSAAVPSLGFGDKYLINRQTAYNRSVVQSCGRCGCFHCGSTFSGSSVVEWLEEEHGEDTALCPYCGEDAVITGTTELPLSTALLTSLYLYWFKREYEALKERATFVPSFSGRDDFMRKGIPFLIRCEDDVEVVGEIGLFPTEIFDARWGNLHDNDVFAEAASEIGRKSRGGLVSAKAYFDENDYYVSEFIAEDGSRLPYEPWSGDQQDLLLDLTERYGDLLKGVIPESDFGGKMRLIVNRQGVE